MKLLKCFISFILWKSDLVVAFFIYRLLWICSFVSVGPLLMMQTRCPFMFGFFIFSVLAKVFDTIFTFTCSWSWFELYDMFYFIDRERTSSYIIFSSGN